MVITAQQTHKPTHRDTYDERQIKLETDTSIPSLFDDPTQEDIEDYEN